MSKKTKKEKIIADLRRQLGENQKTYSIPKSTITFSEVKNVVENRSESKPLSDQTKSIYIYPVQLIKKDLTKTLVLCILAISLEIALYLSSFKLGF